MSVISAGVGIAECKAGQRSRNRTLSICRGVLTCQPTASCAQLAAELLDLSGRKVMDLQPGENDVRHLAPGVYFVRRPMTEDGRPRAAVRKVVIQR